MQHTDPTSFDEDLNQTALMTFCSLLSVSKRLDLFFQLLTIIAFGVGIVTSWWTHHWLLTLLIFALFICGLIAKYYAIRLYFDKKLFDYLAEHFDQLPRTLIELDRELINLHLIKSNPSGACRGKYSGKVRTITERKNGTLRLLKKQVIMYGIQILLLMVILLGGVISC